METQVKEIKINLPTDVLLSANTDQEHIAQEMREALAYKYFSQGRLSSGKAAKLAGISRIEFLLNAHKYNVEWLSYSQDEIRRELS
jgi:predicted HTH domain antitoxin